ncbi:hypothetical protein Tco_1306040, partial [Tanacetum coccineum]
DIKILKLDIKLRDNALTELRKKFEKAEKERDDLKLTLENFRNSSKNLSKLLEIHMSIPDVTTSEAKTSVSKPKFVGEPLIEDWISDSEDGNETGLKSKQSKPSFTKIEFVKSNDHVKIPREFVKKKMVEKTVWNNARRANHQNSQRMTHPHPKGNFVPKAVLMKSGIKPLNTARPINTTYIRPTMNSARKASNVLNIAHTHVRRPFKKSTSNKNSNLKEKVNIVKGDVTTVGNKKSIGHFQVVIVLARSLLYD